MASASLSAERVFVGPGLSPFKRVVTILGVTGSLAVILWIAFYQHATRADASVIGSTIAAILFLAGFVWYLRLIAPVPFTITLSDQHIVKRDKRGDVIDLSWKEVTRIREEFFKNGKRIGVTVYRQVTEPGQKAKAWAVYRDEVDDLDALAETLRQLRPASVAWESERVHD